MSDLKPLGSRSTSRDSSRELSAQSPAQLGQLSMRSRSVGQLSAQSAGAPAQPGTPSGAAALATASDGGLTPPDSLAAQSAELSDADSGVESSGGVRMNGSTHQ